MIWRQINYYVKRGNKTRKHSKIVGTQQLKNSKDYTKKKKKAKERLITMSINEKIKKNSTNRKVGIIKLRKQK